MSKILIGFDKTKFNPYFLCPEPDMGEKLGNFCLGLLRLAIGKSVRLTKVDNSRMPNNWVYKDTNCSLLTRIAAIFAAIILLPLTLLLTLVGTISVSLSKSYAVEYAEYTRWKEYLAFFHGSFSEYKDYIKSLS